MKRTTTMFAVLLLATVTAVSQTAWNLDKAHSSVGFSVTHMVVSTVPGSFTDFDVELTSAKPDFSDASVTATIRTESISTDNDRRDGHLKSDDFFNAERFPTISFVSKKFEKVGEKSYKIHGDLTIRDITKPVVFDAALTGVLNTPRGTLTGWKATTSINRFDYNLKWNRAIEAGGLVVGETVDIVLNAEFNKPSQSGS